MKRIEARSLQPGDTLADGRHVLTVQPVGAGLAIRLSGGWTRYAAHTDRLEVTGETVSVIPDTVPDWLTA